MHAFPYSILRLEPDPQRGEQVNVGLVVFLEDRLDVHLIPQPYKVKALDPNFDPAALKGLKSFLSEMDIPQVAESHADNAEARRAFLANMPGATLSRLGFFSLPHIAAYDEKINQLMRELVLPPPRASEGSVRYSRLESQIRSDLRKQGLFSLELDDIHKHKVVPRYPIEGQENLVADFAMRNGVLHVCAALDLRGKEETIRLDKFRQGAVKAITLDRARKTEKGCKTFAVIAAPEDILHIAQPHIAMLHDYSHQVFNLMDAEGADGFYRYIREATHHA